MAQYCVRVLGEYKIEACNGQEAMDKFMENRVENMKQLVYIDIDDVEEID